MLKLEGASLFFIERGSSFCTITSSGHARWPGRSQNFTLKSHLSSPDSSFGPETQGACPAARPPRSLQGAGSPADAGGKASANKVDSPGHPSVLQTGLSFPIVLAPTLVVYLPCGNRFLGFSVPEPRKRSHGALGPAPVLTSSHVTDL